MSLRGYAVPASLPPDLKGMSIREASGKVLNALAKLVPWLIGGAVDLAPSTKTRLTFEFAGDFEPSGKDGDYREHARCAAVNGMTLSAAEAYEARRAQQSALGINMVNQSEALKKQWPSLSFGDFQMETRQGQHHFKVEVNFGGVDPGAMLVELYAEGSDGQPFRKSMVQGDKLPDCKDSYAYTVQVAASRPAGDFTPRLIAKIAGDASALGNVLESLATLIFLGRT
jgi:hypothetical protein